MVLVDRDIRELIHSSVLMNADQARVHAISYDLATDAFYQRDNSGMDTVQLKPNESVFVGCCEVVTVPNTMCMRIELKNSRIRQGLRLDAPVYQPGHKTRIYYRVTNISADVIRLDKEKSIAQVMFETLTAEPEAPYAGGFQNELEFSDMAGYKDIYQDEIEQIEQKTDEIKHIERGIYTNVITLMTVFVAMFSLLNINIQMVLKAEKTLKMMASFDLLTVGCMMMLIFAVKTFVIQERRGKYRWVLAGIGAVLIIAGTITAL